MTPTVLQIVLLACQTLTAATIGTIDRRVCMKQLLTCSETQFCLNEKCDRVLWPNSYDRAEKCIKDMVGK